MKRRIPTKAQQRALLELYRRNPAAVVGSYIRFRRIAFWEFCNGPALMVPWCGMYVGIEPDGHIHT